MQKSVASRSTVLALAATASAIFITGCGVGLNARSVTPVATQGVALHGIVHGGQQPVAGATMQLYAVGNSSYGFKSTPLIASNIQTGANGSFSLDGSYVCPTPSTPVYLVATGGNSGFSNNPNLALMAALGSCGSLSASTQVSVNELTTVAAVYALAPFTAVPSASLNSYAFIGSTPTNQAGLLNAMSDSSILVNNQSGAIPTAPSGMTLPVNELNTLADIMASCVNSAGGSSGDGTPCGTLFANTTLFSGTRSKVPVDTISAFVVIAKRPAGTTAQQTALYNLATAAAPFQPTLAAQPTDFTVAVTLTGGLLNKPSGLAVDSTGNVWVANAGGNSVTEFDHNGNSLSGAGYLASLNAPCAIALAADGTVLVTNRGNNSVSRLSSAGVAVAGSPYTGGGLNLPSSIAFDAQGTAWISNSGSNSVTTFTGSGAAPTQYTPGSASNPIAIAVNPH